MRRLLIFLLLGQFGCNTDGTRGTSDSIQDSKERGTFVGEYELSSTNDSINEITKGQIQEAFIEYGWFVKPSKPIIDTSYFNIGLRLREKDGKILGGHYEQYQIGLDSNNIFTHHTKDGMTLHIWDHVSDTVTFKFYKNKSVIGDLLFIKK